MLRKLLFMTFLMMIFAPLSLAISWFFIILAPIFLILLLPFIVAVLLLAPASSEVSTRSEDSFQGSDPGLRFAVSDVGPEFDQAPSATPDDLRNQQSQ